MPYDAVTSYYVLDYGAILCFVMLRYALPCCSVGSFPSLPVARELFEVTCHQLRLVLHCCVLLCSAMLCFAMLGHALLG